MRLIKLPEATIKDQLQKILSKFHKGKITIDQDSLAQVKCTEKAMVHFSMQARDKVRALVHECNIEIAWYGITRRVDNTFYVDDIIVYPQIAQAAHVTSNDDLYPAWVDAQTDDTINNMRLQGHSHVNMGVGPSGTDDEFYSILVEHIPDYYIMMIANKRDDIWLNIYDMTNNVLYERADIEHNFAQHNDQDLWACQMIDQYITEPVKKVKGVMGGKQVEFDYHDRDWDRRF